MSRLSAECRRAQMEALRRDDLDAVARARLELHLRRCAECREIVSGLEAVESLRPIVPELPAERFRDIYSQLVPAVHEITNQPRRPLFWLPAFDLRMGAAVGAGVAAAAVVVAVLFAASVLRAPQPAGDRVADARPASAASAPVTASGMVQRCEGVVRIDGRATDGEPRLAVRPGMHISVEEGARFSFSIGDAARIALFGKTEWHLTSLTDTLVALRLDAGHLAVQFDGTSGKQCEIETPDALVRVKGTVFTVEVDEGRETRVGVIEGVVEVVSRKGDPRTVEVEKDQGVGFPGSGEIAALSDEQRALAVELADMDDFPEELTRLVRFDGSPEKVKVEVNGRLVGTTPITVRLPDGPFTYRLTSPGLEPISGSISERDGPREIAYDMVPASAYEGIAAVEKTAVKRATQARSGERAKLAKKQAWDLLQRARAAMTAGDVPYAIGLLERAISNETGRRLADVLSLLAECYASVGRYSEAADTFDRFVESDPGGAASQNARYEVGRLSMDQMGDLARARAAFTAYVASSLGGGLKEEAYYSLCELDGREGAHRNALHCFNEFLRAFPGGHHEPDARLWRGALYQDVDRRWADAERDLLSFIRARPRHPRADEARYRVVVGRYQVSDERGALRMIDEYLTQHPNGQYRLRVERLKRAILDPSFSLELDAR